MKQYQLRIHHNLILHNHDLNKTEELKYSENQYLIQLNLKKMNKGLDFLREKYGAKKGEITLKDGHCYVGATPLLPGRMERKSVELKKMTENGTLEGVSTLRFAMISWRS